MRTFHFEKIPEIFTLIFPKIIVTFEYVLLSFAFGLIFAALLAWIKLGKNRIGKKIAYGYTTIVRCVPPIVMIFLVYYGVIYLFQNSFGITLRGENKLVYVVITFTLFLTASLSEVIRSSYEAVDGGQFEAGLSVGMTPLQIVRRIIFPQAFRIAIPNLGNTLIYLFKEGALAYTIGFMDLMGTGYQAAGSILRGFDIEIYVTLAMIYWPLAILIEQIFKLLEKEYGIKYKVSD